MSKKSMTKFFNNLKNTIFGPFPHFWGDLFFIFFTKNTALSHTTLYGFLTSCQDLERINDPTPRKRPD